ncbi:hypothetical protein [Nostoc sp.]
MVNTKCVSYKVDPGLLNAGVPVEQLEKRNEQVLDNPAQELNCYFQGITRYSKTKSVELPKPPDRLEIELGLSDYSKVKAGEPIKISPEIAKHNGEKFKIRNKGTTSYVVRSLVVVGERGYFYQ